MIAAVKNAPPSPNNIWQGTFLATVSKLFVTEDLLTFDAVVSLLKATRCDDVLFGLFEGLLEFGPDSAEKCAILFLVLINRVSSPQELSSRAVTLALRICRRIVLDYHLPIALQRKATEFTVWILTEFLPRSSINSVRTEVLAISTTILIRDIPNNRDPDSKVIYHVF